MVAVVKRTDRRKGKWFSTARQALATDGRGRVRVCGSCRAPLTVAHGPWPSTVAFIAMGGISFGRGWAAWALVQGVSQLVEGEGPFMVM